jgi:iron uptake system component EfeO
MIRPRTHLLPIAAAGLFAFLLAGCGGSGSDSPAGATALSFKLTDAGCQPHDATAPAGPIEIEAENTGSTSVTEIEVLEGETILGEEENLVEGSSGGFSLTLDKGKYTLRCNGGEQEDGTLTVGGSG